MAHHAEAPHAEAQDGDAEGPSADGLDARDGDVQGELALDDELDAGARAPRGGSGRRVARPRRRDDDLLIAGIRCGDERALREFFTRFHPVLELQAQRMRVPLEERAMMVDTFMDDFALKIVAGTTPNTLAGFVVSAFRNYVIDGIRRDRASSATMDTHAEVVSGDRVLTGGCSEYSLRVTHGSDDSVVSSNAESNASDDAIRALARHLMRSCSDAESQLAVWMAHHVPYADIAAWLGISTGTAKVRGTRLRTKLRGIALAYLETVDAAQRETVRHYLRRVGLIPADGVAAGGPA